MKWNDYLPSSPGSTKELWYCHFMSEYDIKFPVQALWQAVPVGRAVCCFLWVTGVCWVPARTRCDRREHSAAGTRLYLQVWELPLFEGPRRDLRQWQSMLVAPVRVAHHKLQNPSVAAPCSEDSRRELLQGADCYCCLEHYSKLIEMWKPAAEGAGGDWQENNCIYTNKFLFEKHQNWILVRIFPKTKEK